MTSSTSFESQGRIPGRGRHFFPVLGARVLSIALAAYMACAATANGATSGAFKPHTSVDKIHFDAKAKYLVLMVLDGGTPDYFKVTALPHLQKLLAQGVQYDYAMDGILESETPAGHTTIATGSTPRRNGILGFNWAQDGSDYSLFSPVKVQAGAIEHIMEAAHVPTIAGLYKAAHPGGQVIAVSGHKYYAADPLGGPQADAIMYYHGAANGQYVPTAIPGHVPPQPVLANPALIGSTSSPAYGQDDHLATELALSAFHYMRPHVMLINYPEFDWPLGHVDGGIDSRQQVVALMNVFDRDLNEIEKALRKRHILRKTLFVITADHGMAPVHYFVPSGLVSAAVAKAGTKVQAGTYYTAAYLWLADHARAQAASLNILATHDKGIQSVYYLTGTGASEHYVRAGGLSFSKAVDDAHLYLLNTLRNAHAPTVVAFAREGASFANPAVHWRADHGGADWESQHIPLILAGAGVKHGIVTGEPAQLDDVAPTALAAMGITPTGMEGQILTEALQKPPVGPAAAWRLGEANEITPLIRALAAQSKFELTHPAR